jgi:RNA polymerase sigma-70 factor, ECF subfamily
MKTEVNDEQLMLQYAKGDAQAFEQLYQRHKGGLYRYCLRLLGNTAKAEECFQEVWMKLINSRVNYQPRALFTTYLYRIAHNHVIDIVRKEKKFKLEVELDESSDYQVNGDSNEGIADQIIAENRQLALREQIESLPFEQKNTLLLKLDAGLSLEEIADIQNCGRETVKSRLRYANARLKELLGELI